ncbi:hypothetical protein Nepgr_007460 [Nepenthes gracilis]|uniref:NAC domain-containing protein n=1 Tax=Nepenthes gracilis TaxID=150966 RepID=A0AAD3S6X9_NEPGR|nr:hypothetical protein Nepgr_007460 [Nepenthes gracilis]
MDAFHHFDSSETHLPPGFRFHPTDEELITYYLLKKVLDSSFTGRAIAEVDLNKCEPWELPEKAKMGEKEWYFFSLRDRKYPTGLRTNRATEAGYWKATGKDREIYSSKTCSLVGMKKTLVFYRGRAPKGEKSNWVMHEYRLEGKFAYHYLSRSSKDEWVISRVFQKSGTGSATSGSSGNGRKGRLNAGINLYPEVSSPSSVSLPPLLDFSPYGATAPSAAMGAAAADRDNCSYGTEAVANREHVSCFSTIINANSNASACGGFNPHSSSFHGLFAPLPPSLTADNNNGARNLGLPAFPSLRSLQENLQLPFFAPPGVAPSPLQCGGFGAGDQMGVCGLMGNWGGVLEEKVADCGAASGGGGGVRMGLGATELDSMWNY